MTNRVWFTSVCALFAGTIILAGPAKPVTNEFLENFTTKQYCDTLSTTALWDTVAGELKLPPFVPTLVGSYSTNAEAVATAGDHAFVANGWDGLRVIDISDPANLLSVGASDTPGYTRGVAVFGNYAYIADDSGGLQVIDISDPTTQRPLVATIHRELHTASRSGAIVPISPIVPTDFR